MNSQINEYSNQLGLSLLEHSATVVTAESCTGGGIASAITDIPGSSKWFHCGYVTYSNHSKMRDLGIPPALLNNKGAVCEEVAIEMAKSAARLSGANFSIATSGIAGPSGGSEIKPVGTVWFAWLGPLGMRSKKYQFSGDRYAIREQAIEVALKEMLQHVSQ